MNEPQAVGVLLGALIALALLGIPFRIICAWCKGDLGPSFGTYEDSHGICEDCASDLLGGDK